MAFWAMLILQLVLFALCLQVYFISSTKPRQGDFFCSFMFLFFDYFYYLCVCERDRESMCMCMCVYVCVCCFP